MICGKTVFNSRTEANEAMEGLQRDAKKGHYDRSKKQPKVSYFCNDCNGWHISTGTKKKVYSRNKTVSFGEKTKKHKRDNFLIIRNFNR